MEMVLAHLERVSEPNKDMTSLELLIIHKGLSGLSIADSKLLRDL